jgi:hypothetical protein
MEARRALALFVRAVPTGSSLHLFDQKGLFSRVHRPSNFGVDMEIWISLSPCLFFLFAKTFSAEQKSRALFFFNFLLMTNFHSYKSIVKVEQTLNIPCLVRMEFMRQPAY